jgi:hypothetical protein
MRKIVLIFTFLIQSIITLNAQSDTLKPVKGDWGFSLNITGIINNITVENNKDSLGQYNLFARHYIKNDIALRLGFGVNYLNQNTFNEDSVTIVSTGSRALEVKDSSISRFDFKVSLGIEKHLGTTKRLDPYVGGELAIIRIGATNINSAIDLTDVTGTAKGKTIIKVDGGVGFGLLGIAGFNYFISKNLSLGAEFGYGLLYTKSGGDYSNSNNIIPVSGEQTNSFVSGKVSTSQTSIGATPTGGIMLSFFF